MLLTQSDHKKHLSEDLIIDELNAIYPGQGVWKEAISNEGCLQTYPL